MNNVLSTLFQFLPQYNISTVVVSSSARLVRINDNLFFRSTRGKYDDNAKTSESSRIDQKSHAASVILVYVKWPLCHVILVVLYILHAIFISHVIVCVVFGKDNHHSFAYNSSESKITP